MKTGGLLHWPVTASAGEEPETIWRPGKRAGNMVQEPELSAAALQGGLPGAPELQSPQQRSTLPWVGRPSPAQGQERNRRLLCLQAHRGSVAGQGEKAPGSLSTLGTWWQG